MDMENVSVTKVLFKMAPPVMLALLIQSIYNIADSFFVAKYSTEGLTALSIVYPVQLLITALALLSYCVRSFFLYHWRGCFILSV